MLALLISKILAQIPKSHSCLFLFLVIFVLMNIAQIHTHGELRISDI
jgi:hypothetical protein